MASVKETVDKAGRTVFKIQASNGRGRRVTRSWRPQPGWSQKTIDKELRRFCADLENQFSAGAVFTKAEADEAAKREALEAAQVKTLHQYCTGVFMPRKEMILSENSRSSFQALLDLHILPVLGDFLMVDINTL